MDFDLGEGLALADEGRELAATFAEFDASEVLQLFVIYAAKVFPRSFLTVEVRKWAQDNGLVAVVREGRAWGAIPARAARLGYVTPEGFAATPDVKAHAGPRTKWVWSGKNITPQVNTYLTRLVSTGTLTAFAFPCRQMRPLEVALIMTITVTLTFASTEEAITALARLRSDAATPAVTKEADPKPAAAKAKAEPKPSAAEKKDAASTPTAESKANGAAQPETEKKSEAAPDYEPVGAAIKNAVASGKRPQVVEVLAGFGAASGKDLKPEHFGDFMAKLSKALEAAADLG